jgi:kumamolisin
MNVTRKTFHDSIVDLGLGQGTSPTGLVVQDADASHGDDVFHIQFSLAIDPEKEKDLAMRVANGERISASELDSKYGLSANDTAPLKKWLGENGFTFTQESPDHLNVFATAPARVAAKALEFELGRVTKDGITHTAARTAPSLPADVGSRVRDIRGLQGFVQLRKHRIMPRPTVRAVAPAAGPVGNSPPYFPSAILSAFQGSELDLDGSGQKIAILIDTFPLNTDLTAFWETTKVPGSLSRIQKISVNGGQLPAVEGEESLDAEWTSGIAPGATICIYATGSLAFGPLDAGLQKILADAKSDPTLRVVSISLGLGEHETPPAAITTQDQVFLRLAALGVNVFVSTGDDGSSPNGKTEVEFPASDPNVIAVGGSTLRLNPSDASIASETGWSGSGGGKSTKFKRPAWQKGPGVAQGTARLTPDVCAAADPNTGALVQVNGSGKQIGGTSWSAPTWAAIVTLANQARIKKGKPPLPFLNPHLYPLIGSASVRDVVSGSNGVFDAGPGHDLVTGIGSPNVKALFSVLVDQIS